MNKPAVLIIGALIGIGRAAAAALAKDVPRSSFPAGGKQRARLSRPSCAVWVPKPPSSKRMFAGRMRSGARPTKPSHGLGVCYSDEVPTAIEGLAADAMFGMRLRE
jgi:hypothetical protein